MVFISQCTTSRSAFPGLSVAVAGSMDIAAERRIGETPFTLSRTSGLLLADPDAANRSIPLRSDGEGGWHCPLHAGKLKAGMHSLLRVSDCQNCQRTGDRDPSSILDLSRTCLLIEMHWVVVDMKKLFGVQIPASPGTTNSYAFFNEAISL